MRVEMLWALWVLSSIDIDKLTFISSIYGLKIRNEILKKAAQIIKQHTPKEGICCKRGGDGFAVLFQVQEEKDITKLYESLVMHISEIKVKANINYRVELLAGAATYPRHGDEMSVLCDKVRVDQ